MIPITESLYQSLHSKANALVAESFKGYPEKQLKEIAHDITVDFLFFSKSFAITFSEEKGELTPFFASYVRKKCLGLWIKKHDFRTVYIAGDIGLKEDEKLPFEYRFEIRESLKRIVTELSGCGFGKRKNGHSVPLDALLMALLKMAANEGGYSVIAVCKSLGVSSKATVSDAIDYLKRILDERYHLKP